jgi:hypothetical protein
MAMKKMGKNEGEANNERPSAIFTAFLVGQKSKLKVIMTT